MIDLKARRKELQDAVRKCQEQRQQAITNENFLNGGLTLLNELIADQDAQEAADAAKIVDVSPEGESHVQAQARH